MSIRHGFWIPVLGVFLAFDTPPAHAQLGPPRDAAQPTRSHNLAPFALPQGNTEEALLERLGQKQLAETLKKYGLKPEEINNLDKLKEKYPELYEQARKLMEQRGVDLGNINPEQDAPKLQGLLNDLQKNVPGAAPSQPPTTPPATPPGNQLPLPPPPAVQPGAGEVPNPPALPPGELPLGGMGVPGEPPAVTSPMSRSIARLAEQVQRWDPGLRNSRAWRGAMAELTGSMGKEDPRWKKLSESLGGFEERWRLWSGAVRERFFPNTPDWLGRLTPKNVPRVQLPSLPNPSVSVPAGGPAGGGGPVGALLILAGLAVAAVVVWRSWGKLGGAASAARHPGWHLGPWPVEPACVRTRDDLVRAFEYLALRDLGPAARQWNHRLIGHTLGNGGTRDAPVDLLADTVVALPVHFVTDRQLAAEHLADLYARARYAPPGEPLTDELLSAARRDLCLLAGVAAA